MSDLTDRMRTCAAFIVATTKVDTESMTYRGYIDAADLLIEASNALEAIPPPLGELMEIIPPSITHAPPRVPDRTLGGDNDEMYRRAVPKATWTAGDLPAVPTGNGPSPRAPRVCPNCDSRAHKRVFRNGTELYLACPACAHAWPYKANLP